MKRLFSRGLSAPGFGCSPSLLRRAVVIAGAALMALPVVGRAQSTVYWRSGATSGWWASGDGDENRWYRASDGWDVRREDLADGQWSSSGTKAYVIVRFDNGNQATMTVNALGGAKHSLNQIIFDNSTSRSFAQDGGAYLSMGGGSGNAKIETTSNGSGTYTFNLPLNLEKATEINPVYGTLTFNSAITNNGNNISIWGDNAKTLNLSGAIVGSGALSNNQNSFVNITGANVGFSGPLVVNKGTVRIGTSTNAVSSGSVFVGTNAQLQVNLNATWRPVTATLAGTGISDKGAFIKYTDGGDMTWPGSVVFANTSSINSSNGTLTIGGVMSGAGQWTKLGAGTLILTGNNTFTGNSIVSNGALRITHGNGLGTTAGSNTVVSGAALELSGGITSAERMGISGTGISSGGAIRNVSGNNTLSGVVAMGANSSVGVASDTLAMSGVVSGGYSLTKIGTGTLGLSADNTFSGGMTISAGTVNVSGHSNSVGRGAVTVASGATLEVASGMTVNPVAMTISGNGTAADVGAIHVLNGGTMQSAITLGADAKFRADGSALTLRGDINAGSYTLYFTNSAIADMTLGSVSGTKTAGDGALRKTGAGRLLLRPATGLTGSIYIDQGELRIGTGTMGAGGPMYLAGGVQLSSDSGTARTIPKIVTLTGNPTLGRSGSGTLTLSGGMDLSGATRVATLASDVVVSGVISNGGLTKLGADRLSVSAANTFSGGLKIEEGVVQSTANAASLGASTVTLGASSGSANAHLEFSGAARTHANDFVIASGSSGVATITNAGNVSITLSGGFTVNKAVSLSPVGGASSVINVNGAVSGSANIDVNAGSGNYVSFGGNNSSFSGTMNVNSGTSRLAVANSMSSAGSVMVGASGTLDVRAGVTVGYLTGTGLVKNDSGSGSTLTLSPASGTTTFGGSLQNGSGTLSLTKAGSATQVLTGASSYSGNTAVSAGTLVMNGTNTSTAVTVASGATLMGSGAVGGLTVQNGGTVRPGASASAIGNLAVSSLAMNNGSSARFKIGNASNSADRDFISNSGSATISATTTIYLDDSLLSNFNPALSYSWNLIVGGITASGNFTLNDTTYWSTSKAGGTFSLSASGNNLVLTFTPVAGEPTTQATSIGFTSYGTTSIALNWTSGDGANRIVVARAGGAVNANPNDNTTYTANATFGSGTQIGTGNYVVYNGSGNSVTVSGLSANTVYHFRVYEFNGTAGNEDYLTSTATGNPASQTTLATEPSTQATTVTFSSLGNTSMTLNWTSGDGANRLVIVRQGSAPSSGPVDGTSYTADANFGGSGSALGGGKVVYQGAGSSVAISGLSASTLYYVQVFEYNGSGASLNYNVNTASGNPGNRYTLAAEPSGHASAFSATAASASQINLSWTAAGGPPSGYIIIQRSGAAPTGTPTDGTGYSVSGSIGDGTVAAIVTPGSATSANITGLSAGTTYHFVILPFNWDGANAQTYNYRTAATIPSANATTLATEPSTQATAITLSSRTKSSLSISWTSGNGANRVVVVREASAVNSNPVDATAYTANAVFGSGSQIGTGNYVVYGGAGSSVTITGLKTNTAYHIRVYEYNGSAGTLNYNVNTASGNPNNFTTQDNEPGIGVGGPITLSTTVGSNPAAGSFIVTNLGGSALSYVVSDDVGWLSVSPLTATNKANGQTESHAITYAVAGLQAGVSNATITVTQTGAGENAATNSPRTIAVQLTLNAIPNPTAVSVQGEAPEFNRLFWTKNASYDVMVVHRAGGTPSVPVNNTSYSVGDTYGTSTRVIYKGSAATLDHVVTPGTVNEYAFYSINNNYYSAGVAGQATNALYTPNVTIEQFSYTNGLSLNGLSGGPNWSTAWSVGSGSFAVSTQQFTQTAGYPTMGGNIIVGTNSQASRDIAAISSGKIYVAFKFRNEAGGATDWSGLSFFNGGTELKFVGESYAGNQNFAVGSTLRGAGSLLPNTDYTIIVMHDFTANTTYGNIYTNGVDTISATEPVTWQVVDSGAMAQVTRIRVDGNNGMRWDEIRIATNWTALLNLADTDPGLTVTPTNFNISLTKGSVTSQTFTVGNTGTLGLVYTNTVTYGSGSGWLTVAPTGQVVAGGGSLINTGTVSAAGLAVGSYVATNRVAGNQTNAAIDVVFNVTVTALTTPTAVSVTADGSEMVRLAWSSASDVMIVYRNGSDLSADPTDNTAYSVGDSLGGGTVIWKGSATDLEHIVAQGTPHYYRIYAVNNNNYSAPASGNATTFSYISGEVIEAFSYTNLASLGSLNGGQGWSAGWTVDSGTWGIRPSTASNNMTTITGYPFETGNKVRMSDPGNGGSGSAVRTLPTYSTGTVYVAGMISYGFRGTNKWAGIELASNGISRAFFGKLYANTNLFGLNSHGKPAVPSAFEINPFSGGAGDTNNVYLIVARYNFATRVMDAKAYYRAATVPEVEPGSWDATDTLPAGRMDSFNGVRLTAGSGAADGSIGRVDFDEIRVAQSWAELLNVTPAVPYAMAYQIGSAGNEVTDAALAAGTFPVVMNLWADSGIESVSVTSPYFKPDFDLLLPDGTAFVNNQIFANFSYKDGGKTLIASNDTHAGAAYADIVLGSYTGRWSAISSNAFSTINAATLSNGTAIAFTVIDDDVTPPEVVNINSTNVGGGSSRLMHIAIDGTNLSANGAAMNNIMYTTTDGALADISSSKPLLIWLGARDDSGLSRGGNPALDSHLSIGSAIVSNVTQYDASRSDPFASTTNARATNVWSWITPLSNSELESLVATTASEGSNAVVMTWRDADNDRANDRTSITLTQGWFRVTDDDTTPPTIQNFRIWGAEGSYTVRVDELISGTGWGITGRVSDSGSGINVNGATTTQPDNSPYFELWDSTGAMRFRQAFDTLSFSDGGATTLSSLGSGAAVVSGVSYGDVGVWTARVIVADNDSDYGANDHSIGTNEIPFTLVSGASLGGIGVGPTTFAITSSYGVVTGTSPWPNFVVTNIGAGTLTYSANVSYSGAGGWLIVTPSGGSITGNGATQSHASSIDASALSPGIYTATITLNGNQTNAAQTVTVTMRVYGYYPGEIVDQFTNGVSSLEGVYGGSGWSGAWDNSPDAGFSINSGSLTVPDNYPANSGNKVCADTSSSKEIQTYRYFGQAFTTGKVFVAIAVRKTDGNADGYHGVSFMDGGTEKVFFGKLFNGGNFGIDLSSNGGAVAGNFGVTGVGDPGYFYIGMYDFAENKAFGRAYNNSDTIPVTEPNWSVSNSPLTAITSINGVRIAAKDEGTFCFDEVRVASSWEGLLNLFTAEPNVHASGITFSDVATNSMVVSWTPGNGANRIVIAREGSPVTYSPTDSVSLAFNNNFGTAADIGSGNKIVYNGGGTSFTMTGLNPATRYYFAIYEYNGAPPNYYTNAGWATGDRWTISTEPANPVITFNAYPASDTTMTNKWTLPGGTPAPDGFLILRRQGSPVTYVPVDGVGYTNGQVVPNARVTIVTPGTAAEVLQTALTSCVDYYFTIYPFRWNGVSAETYNYLTNSAASATAETECVAPILQASNIVFTVTDTNRISLSWQRGNGQSVLLVVRGTNAVNQNPLDGTTYTANSQYASGSHLGDGNYVVYIGTGTTATITGLQSDTAYHFRLYEFNGAGAGIDYNVNTAVENPRDTKTASFGLVEDKFIWNYFGDYANNNLYGAGTGTGWTNSWFTFGHYAAVDDANSPAFKGYPSDTRTGCGNNCNDSRQIKIVNNDGTAGGISRGFPARNSGKLYMAVKINIQDTSDSSTWAGISFMDGATEVAFLGKGYGNTTELTLVDNDGHSVTNSTHNDNSTWRLFGGTPYLLVMEYDFEAKILRGMGLITDMVAPAIPEMELAWNVEIENVDISRIDGIRIAGRGVGDLIIDHIRIGPTWDSTIWNLPPNWHEDYGPVPTLVYIGTNYNPAVYSQVITNLSDAELRSSQLIDFAIRWDSPSGIFLTNSVATNFNQGSKNARVTPNWDPLAVGVASNRFNLDKYFTNYFGVNGAQSVTTYQKNAFSVTNIDFEVRYFVTVSAETDPGGSTVSAALAGFDPVPVNRAVTINEPLRFYVYDDDTNAPALGTRPMRVLTNSTFTSAQSAGNGLERHFVYDGDLGQTGIRLSFNAFDEYSGIQRSASGAPDTNMTVTIPFVTTNDNANYNATWSATDSKQTTATSVWEFAANVFTWQRVSDMWGGDGTSLQGQDLEVTAHIPDADDDRVEDQTWSSNQVMGFIRVLDDDTEAPREANVHYQAYGPKPFYVLTNGFAIGDADSNIRGTYARRTGLGSNTAFAVTDGELAKSGSSGLQFAFGAIDQGSGVRRGASGDTNGIMSWSVTNILVGVSTGWDAGLSTSVNAPGVPQTNIWTFPDGYFTDTIITQLMAVTGSSGSGSNRVAVTIPDSDDDRANDGATFYDQMVGWLRVYDDDINGPQISGASVLESTGGGTILSSSFETNQGWIGLQSSTTAWTNNDSIYGNWVGVGVLQTSLDPKNTGTRRIGLLTNSIPGPFPYIQLPPVNNPGQFTVYAGRVGGGSGTPIIRLEWLDGNTWQSLGDRAVVDAAYTPMIWTFDDLEDAVGVTLRVSRVENGEQRTQVYLDDFAVNSYMSWIGTNDMVGGQVHVAWNAAVDDYSGVAAYRVVAPADNAVTPTAKTHGDYVNPAVTSQTFSIQGQGVITGYVFAVDDDSDRLDDDTMGNVLPLLVKVDTNPPPVVTALRATDAAGGNVFDASIDDSSEIKVEWATGGASEEEAAGWRQSDSAPLSPWDSYIITYYEVANQNGDPLANSITTTLDRVSANWSNVLDNWAFTNLVISNLQFDAHYKIDIQARDRAGNIGLATSVVGNTDRFLVTQGLTRVNMGLDVRWTGPTNEAVTRDYDVIYVDSAQGFRASLSNNWAWLTYTNHPRLVDYGGTNRITPGLLTGTTYRLYRVAKQDRWRTNQPQRVASVEIYAAKGMRLNPGENWYSLFSLPDPASTNETLSTVAYTFGTNTMPAGASYAQSTRISWFGSTVGATNFGTVATSVVWLSQSAGWQYAIGGSGPANEKRVPLGEGFLIELPVTAQPTNLVLIGRVATQSLVRVIPAPVDPGTPEYHLLSQQMTERITVAAFMNQFSSFGGAAGPTSADELRVLRNDPTNGVSFGSLREPRMRIYKSTLPAHAAAPWRHVVGRASAMNDIIEPDDAIFILRRSGGADIVFTNAPTYPPPTRNMTP